VDILIGWEMLVSSHQNVNPNDRSNDEKCLHRKMKRRKMAMMKKKLMSMKRALVIQPEVLVVVDNSPSGKNHPLPPVKSHRKINE
jgi:hypothetical protein